MSGHSCASMASRMTVYSSGGALSNAWNRHFRLGQAAHILLSCSNLSSQIGKKANISTKELTSRQNRLGNQYIESVMEKNQIEACELPKICIIS